jgi:hypothetical protein
MRIRALFALSAMALAAVPVPGAPPPAREVWLPPAVEDGAARQTVDGVATRIETMGEEGVLENAPTFPGLELPRAGQRHLDAMAGWHPRPACASGIHERVTVARGPAPGTE